MEAHILKIEEFIDTPYKADTVIDDCLYNEDSNHENTGYGCGHTSFDEQPNNGAGRDGIYNLGYGNARGYASCSLMFNTTNLNGVYR